MAGGNIERRTFLQSALAAGAFALGGGSLNLGCAVAEGRAQRRRFMPVKVSRDRLIRTVVGLRPYRPEGFVVRAERLGEKIVIHNYGHGGAGVTLSWGTSALAAEHARATGRQQFAVLGCGVMGLSTARLLQRQGRDVTIYAKGLPPETTSNVAGALWLPTSVFNQQKVGTAFLEQFGVACKRSNEAFQTLVGGDYGVRWIETFELRGDAPAQERELAGGAQLYPDTKIHKDPKQYFGFPHTRQFSTMLIEPSVYMRALMRDYQIAGGRVVVKEFRGCEEIEALKEPVVMNCTGLGARELFDDRTLIPVRGQLEFLLPQPELDYCYLMGSYYMFPRSDGVVLGGTFEHERWALEADPTQTADILEGHADVMKGLRR